MTCSSEGEGTRKPAKRVLLRTGEKHVAVVTTLENVSESSFVQPGPPWLGFERRIYPRLRRSGVVETCFDRRRPFFARAAARLKNSIISVDDLPANSLA
jgi:hypothetical protein